MGKCYGKPKEKPKHTPQHFYVFFEGKISVHVFSASRSLKEALSDLRIGSGVQAWNKDSIFLEQERTLGSLGVRPEDTVKLLRAVEEETTKYKSSASNLWRTAQMNPLQSSSISSMNFSARGKHYSSRIYEVNFRPERPSGTIDSGDSSEPRYFLEHVGHPSDLFQDIQGPFSILKQF